MTKGFEHMGPASGGVLAKRTTVQKKHEGVYHHGDLKVAMRKAALQLVRQKGARGFSINEASRLAGVSVGAPYRHFADKDALLAEVACEGFALLTRRLLDASERTPDTKQAMVAAGLAYIRFSRQHADYFSVMFRSGLNKESYPDLERSGQEAFAVIFELAKHYEQRPELAGERALFCWALVHGLATLMADGALPLAAAGGAELTHLRPLLERSLDGW